MLHAFSKVFEKIVNNRLQLVFQILLVWLHGEGNQRWLASITIYTFAVIPYPIHNCWNGRLIPATVVVLRWSGLLVGQGTEVQYLRHRVYRCVAAALYLLCADTSLLISAVILCVFSSVLVTRKVSMLLAKPRPKISSFAVSSLGLANSLLLVMSLFSHVVNRQRKQTYIIYIYIYIDYNSLIQLIRK